MANIAEFLEKNLESHQLVLTQVQKKQLVDYMNHILEWNEKINLTAIKNEEEFVVKHFIDSLIIMSLEQFQKAETILDIGTGGGFPGIPLAIAYPDKKFYLVDSLNKRIKVINEGIEKLGIRNVETLHSRAEDLKKNPEYAKGFDLVVSRAVANMKKLSGYMLPYVKRGGYALALKGPIAEEELKDALGEIKKLRGKNPEILKLNLDHSNHNVISIEK